MAIGTVSFTGAMIVQGNQRKQDKVNMLIGKEAESFDKYGLPLKENFKFAAIPMNKSTNETLYLTNDEVPKLLKYFRESGTTKFYADKIKKYIDLPEVKYSGKEVLSAIKNGLFDAANLVIKNK